VHEFRISFSDFERAKINRLERAAIANVALDATTDVLKAAGMALGGGGALLAAYVLLKWKAPQIIAEVQEAANGFLDGAVDAVRPGTPAEDRRAAQAFAVRRGEIAKREATYCTFSSDKYDEAECERTQQMKDQYFAELEAFRRMLMSRYTKEQRAAIYAGLGDINPDFVEGGNTQSYDDYISAVTKTIWRNLF
jgi:hypothetical protein